VHLVPLFGLTPAGFLHRGAGLVDPLAAQTRGVGDRRQIAPVVRLDDVNDLREAAAGKRPQYVAVPRLGSDFFADLDGITTVAKTALLACERVAGVETDQEVREFAFAVSRRFGRFAYPDEVVVKCLNPLTKALQSKARKEQSPLGRVLTGVHSLRVQCDDWTQAPYELTLIVILEPGVVPSDPDDVGDPPNDLNAPIGKSLATQINTYANFAMRKASCKVCRSTGCLIVPPRLQTSLVRTTMRGHTHDDHRSDRGRSPDSAPFG
jgi:hypothetical protein